MTKQKNNKRKRVLILSVIILSILTIAFGLIFYNSMQGERPFENLTVEEVKSISLYSQNVTQEIVYTL